MKYLITVLLVSVGLAGCSTEVPEHLSPDFGNAVRSNIAKQVVNPDPSLGPGDWDSNGERANGAVERYRKDRVTPPVAPYQSIVPEARGNSGTSMPTP